MDSVVQTVLTAVITTLLFLPVLYKILQVREPNFEYFRFIVLLLGVCFPSNAPINVLRGYEYPYPQGTKKC